MDDQLAKTIVKALGYTENGGKPNISHLKKGKSGEMKSIFQYTPATWKNYSQQVSGHTNVPMTPETETAVTYQKVKKWLDQGYKPEQIFSMWNAGVGESDAYTGKFSDGSPSQGKNKYGVNYDVPSYVESAMKHLNEFSTDPNKTSESTPSGVLPQQQDTLNPIISLMKQAKSTSSKMPQKSNQSQKPGAGLLSTLSGMPPSGI